MSRQKETKLILLKNVLSLFESPCRGGWGEADEAEFGTAEELPADGFAGLDVQRGGQGHGDVDEQAGGAALGADHLHFHFVLSLHKFMATL